MLGIIEWFTFNGSVVHINIVNTHLKNQRKNVAT